MLKLSILSLLIISIVELLFWFKDLGRLKKLLAALIILSLPIANGLLISSSFNLLTLLILVLSGYRVINLLRLIEGRSHARYIFNLTRTSAYALISFQIVIGGSYYLINRESISLHALLEILDCLSLLAVSLFLLSLRKNYKSALSRLPDKPLAQTNLPSLSVAIPARNETYDLEECLKTLVMSDYLKLEIIVLDDCSQNKRTPEIIKEFAHEGVRFIAGKELPPNWAAKNYAYQQLYEAANGEVVLFCGVDCRFEPNSLKEIVEHMLTTESKMLSLMPVNSYLKPWDFRSVLQPLRYGWELILPRKILNRPAVLSTCWIIDRTALKNLGSFKAIKNSMSIESYFARHLNTGGSYKFVVANKDVPLASYKSAREMVDTAIRVRYPQTHRRPEIVSLISILELFMFLLPLYILIYSLANRNWLLTLVSAFVIVVSMYVMSLLVKITYRRSLLLSGLLYIVASLIDIAILNVSMWRYEFGEVIWKDRNVCYPLSRV